MLSVSHALKIIADDMCPARDKIVVFMIAVDEFHRLEAGRLRSVVQRLGEILVASHSTICIVPVFAGLYLGELPTVADSSNIPSSLISITPLSIHEMFDVYRFPCRQPESDGYPSLADKRTRLGIFQMGSVPKVIMRAHFLFRNDNECKRNWCACVEKAKVDNVVQIRSDISSITTETAIMAAYAITQFDRPSEVSDD